VYGNLQITMFRDVESAVESAEDSMNHGYEKLHGIETPDRWIDADSDEYKTLSRALWQQDDAERAEREAQAPPVLGKIQVHYLPRGEQTHSRWVLFEVYTSQNALDDDYGALVAGYGTERVRIVR
jgi:hypothetical protein